MPPFRIVLLYCLLWLRMLTDGIVALSAVIRGDPFSSISGKLIFGVPEFIVCLVLLVGLFQRRSWVLLMFRVYIGIVMAISVLVMAAAWAKTPGSGAGFSLTGAVIAACGLSWFAWYVARPAGRAYFPSEEPAEPAPPELPPQGGA